MTNRDSVIETLKLETQRRRDANRTLRWIIGGVTTLAVGLTGVNWWRTGELDVLLLVSQLGLITGGATIGLSPKLKGALLALADDHEALPYLIDALDSADKDVVPLATQLLTVKLSKLREEDAGRFDPPRIAALARAMVTTSNPEFAIAILGAMRYIGTAQELSSIDLVAKGQQMNMAKAHRERLSQLGLSAAADLRMRLARSVIEARSQEAASGVERATAGLPSIESAPESDEVRLRA